MAGVRKGYMPIEDVIHFLRGNLLIQDRDYEYCEDYAKLSDHDLKLWVQVAATRNFSGTDLSVGIPNAQVYPIVYLTKKEIYWHLATAAAPWYDIKAKATSLMRDQRFQHYLDLIKLIDAEYDAWLEDGGDIDGGGSGEDGDQGYGSGNNMIKIAHLTNKYDYWGPRGRQYGQRPEVRLDVVNVGTDFMEVTWSFPKYTFFGRLFLYIISGEGPVFDAFNLNTPMPGATIAVEWRKFPERGFRIENLMPGVYSVGTKYIEANGLYAVDEITNIEVGGEQNGDAQP